MNHERYLQRLNFTDTLRIDYATFALLHERHVYEVPFENLDVHYRKLFTLQPARVYHKVVENYRGGFCYELNSLFNELLKRLNFESSLISARIINEGVPGPEYDHMCVHVKLGGDYLVDVGFGDLFVKPLEIRSGVQHDGRNFFRIEDSDGDYLLSMSGDGTFFEEKYTFRLAEVPLEKFEQPSYDKQVNPRSYFVQNTICTKPVPNGRITIFNNKLIEKQHRNRMETTIADDAGLRHVLESRFDIRIL